MKEHPILMSTPMVKSILEGRKTETRRVIKPQPDECIQWKAYPEFWDKQSVWVNCDTRVWCPYGQIKDHLWVRETWRLEMHSGFYDIGYKSGSFKKDAGSNPHMAKYQHLKQKCWIWRPSIFMPRWASRITLEITDIRVQRLQEISENDAKAEGCEKAYLTNQGYFLQHEQGTYKQGYEALWDSINGKKYPWSMNPWVWTISFRVVR